MKNFFTNGKNLVLKNKKNMVIAIVVFILLFFAIFKIISSFFGGSDGTQISSNEVVTLKKGDVINSVSEKGKIVPSNSVDVFAEKSLPVVNLSVKVGDKVKRGDIIGELDSSSIRQQLDSRKASKAANDKSVSAQISAAKKRLDEAISGRDSGKNAALVSAENAVTSAMDQYLLAQKNYEDYKRSIDERYNDSIVAERSTRENAAYQEEAQNLRYRQQKEDIENNIEKASDSRKRSAESARKSNYIQSDVDNYKRRITDIGISMKAEQEKISNEQAKITEAQSNISSLQADLQNENAKVPKDEAKIKEIEGKIKEQEKVIEGINLNDIKEDVNRRITELTREQNEIEIAMGKASEELASAKSDEAKYKSEAEALEKELEAKEKSLETTKLELNKAKEDLAQDADKSLKAQKSREDQLKTLEKNIEVAKNNYDAALRTLDSTKKQIDNEISSLSDNLNNARASSNNVANVEISNLREDLEKTIIRANADGTITELNVKEGEVPTGAVAKIETIDTLRIESQIKEYDRNSIKVGTEVEITSDSAMDEKYKAKIISIDPVPIKQGVDNKSGEVNYKVTIDLDEDNKNIDKLIPGMSLRVKYILSQSKDTFKVPTDAIFERENKKYILALTDIGKGNYKIEKVEVNTGISNEVETAISSKELKESTKVLSSAGGYGEGSIIKIVDTPEVSNGKK